MKLWQYLAKRLYHTMITILIVLVILYALFQAMPGDPASMLKNPQMDMNAIATIERMYGLDKPWYVQFTNYIRNMAGYPLMNSSGVIDTVSYDNYLKSEGEGSFSSFSGSYDSLSYSEYSKTYAISDFLIQNTYQDFSVKAQPGLTDEQYSSRFGYNNLTDEYEKKYAFVDYEKISVTDNGFVSASTLQPFYDPSSEMFSIVIQIQIVQDELEGPPGSVSGTDRFLVGQSPSGPWANHSGELASYTGTISDYNEFYVHTDEEGNKTVTNQLNRDIAENWAFSRLVQGSYINIEGTSTFACNLDKDTAWVVKDPTFTFYIDDLEVTLPNHDSISLSQFIGGTDDIIHVYYDNGGNLAVSNSFIGFNAGLPVADINVSSGVVTNRMLNAGFSSFDFIDTFKDVYYGFFVSDIRSLDFQDYRNSYGIADFDRGAFYGQFTSKKYLEPREVVTNNRTFKSFLSDDGQEFFQLFKDNPLYKIDDSYSFYAFSSLYGYYDYLSYSESIFQDYTPILGNGFWVANDLEDFNEVHTTHHFGYSFSGSRPLLVLEWKYCPLKVGNIYVGLPVGVEGILKEKIPPTLLLFGTATFLAYTVGCSIGALLAWKHGTKTELGAIFLSLVFYSMPLFWFGLILLWAFASPLGFANWVGMDNALFPLGGYGGYDPETGDDYVGFKKISDIAWHLALPLFTLCFLGLAGDILLMRNSMLEVMGEDFINTARAKGCPERTVLFKHAARNALLPVVTSFALSLGGVIGGGVLTETVFSWPGMGRELVSATVSQDFPVVFTLFYIMALMTIVGNVAADLLYAYLDPRVRL